MILYKRDMDKIGTLAFSVREDARQIEEMVVCSDVAACREALHTIKRTIDVLETELDAAAYRAKRADERAHK